MSYTFACLGDLHLTSGPRNADRVAALDYAIADARRAPLDAWLWPGDLTHSGMTIELRNLLVDRVTAMAHVAPVVIVPGNHDPDGDLDFLARLHAVWPVYVARTPQVMDVVLRWDRSEPWNELEAAARKRPLALFCLPYPNKARLVSAGVPPDQMHAVVDAALDRIFMQAGADLEAARADGRLTGVIGHVSIGGAVSSSGQPQIGTELEISPQHLARLGDCFQVFNHIHKHQRVGSAVYCGSLCRLDWGEREPKGYVHVTCAPAFTADAPTQWSHAEQFLPVPVAPMYHVDGTLTRSGFAYDTAGLPTDWTGCDVRVRASYVASERDVLVDARERVRRQFAGARRFEFEPVAVPERQLRAPEVVEAQTLRDKLQAWARLTETAWSAEVVRCADLLEGTEDGDAVVASVEARLRPLTDVKRLTVEA